MLQEIATGATETTGDPLVIYTDGSAMNGIRMGGAAAVITDGDPEAPNELMYRVWCVGGCWCWLVMLRILLYEQFVNCLCESHRGPSCIFIHRYQGTI